MENNNQIPSVDDVFGLNSSTNNNVQPNVVNTNQEVAPQVTSQPSVEQLQQEIEIMPNVPEEPVQVTPIQQPSIETLNAQPQVVEPVTQPTVEAAPAQQFFQQPVAEQPTQSVQPTIEVQPQVIQSAVTPQTVDVPQQPVQPVAQQVVQQPTVEAQPQVQQQVVQPQMQPMQSPVEQQLDDDALLRSFVGPNYEKISGRPINFAAFFFSYIYMFYRKMYVYGIVALIIFFALMYFLPSSLMGLSLIINIALLLAFNPIYMKYSKSKVEEIKNKKQGKSQTELMEITRNEGGVSTRNIFIAVGVSILISGSFYAMGIANIMKAAANKSTATQANKSSKTIENVILQGHSCINGKCTVTIEDANQNSQTYNLNLSNQDLFINLNRYSDYIKLNLELDSSDAIVGYKVYSKADNSLINASTEEEIRSTLGLYSLGSYNEKMTLKEIGTTGFGFKNDASYTYRNYTFVNEKGIELEMVYEIDEYELDLDEGTEYNVKFEVTEGIFDYDYKIKSVSIILD